MDSTNSESAGFMLGDGNNSDDNAFTWSAPRAVAGCTGYLADARVPNWLETGTGIGKGYGLSAEQGCEGRF
jgi:hypothetical protein